jgi:hypothetical protein
MFYCLSISSKLCQSWWMQVQQSNCPHLCPSQRHWPHAPSSAGEGLLCMPLCFWATQTAVAALDLGARIGRLSFEPYLPSIMAAAVIQQTFCSYLNYGWEWWRKLSWAGYALELKMNRAMCNLWDSNNFVFLVCTAIGSVVWTMDKRVGCRGRPFSWQSFLLWVFYFLNHFFRDRWSVLAFLLDSWVESFGLPSSFSLYTSILSTTSQSVGGCFDYVELSS